MTRFLTAVFGAFALFALSLSASAYSPAGSIQAGAQDVIEAKKKCKSGYVYDPKTKKCYPRGSH